MIVQKKRRSYLNVESKSHGRIVEVYLETKSKPELRKVRTYNGTLELTNIFGEELVSVRML